jgi:hypothetical protein
MQRRFLTKLLLFVLSMSPALCGARTWHVPGDAPTIQAGIDSASVGDDILVAEGTYREHDIRMKAGVHLRSELGQAATAVDAGGVGRIFDCLNLESESIIDGFEIRNGYASGQEGWGGGVRCISSQLRMRGCLIRGCVAENEGGGIATAGSELALQECRIVECVAINAGGINSWDTSLTMTDCEVRGNRARASDGGMFAHGREVSIVGSAVTNNMAEWGLTGGMACVSPALRIERCRVSGNRSMVFAGGGIAIYESAGVVTGCTVVDNRGTPDPVWGIVVDSHSSIDIEETVIAFHDGGGIGCGYGAAVRVRCCDVYGNEQGDELCGSDLGGNFSADPLFCNAEGNEYTLDGDSPCLPGNHPDGVDCGLIGALGRGCGALPSGACCFADGSCVVVEEPDCESQDGVYQGDGSACEPNQCEPTVVVPESWGRVKALFR